MVLLKINDLDITGIATMQWQEATISSSESGRDDVYATMTIDPIATKVSIPVTFIAIPWDKVSQILQEIDKKGKGGALVTLTYPDAKAGKMLTKDFYVQDRTAPMAYVMDNTIYWEGLSFTFTEI